MAINEAQLRQIRYGIEQLPDSWYGGVPLNAEPTPAVLDLKNLRRFSAPLLRLTGIQVAANAAVVLRARYDGMYVEQNTGNMLNLFPGAWNLLAKDTLRLNFFGAPGAPVPNYHTFYSLWAIKATVAHKLLMGMALSPDEKALNEKYSVSDLVEKGLAPLPLDYQTDREYTGMGEETHDPTVNITAANAPMTIENLYAQPGEIIVLTRIAALDANPLNVTHFIVGRDDDVGLADVLVFPLSLIPGGEVSCFIPAVREIRLTCQAALVAGNIPFRYTFKRVKINNILNARLGLVPKDQLPGDVWDKVACGIL